MKKPEVIIRVDGNKQTGLGHIYRGIAIAEMLKANFNCSFLINNKSVSEVIPSDFNVIRLPEHAHPEDEVDWISSLFSPADNLLILDGYNFNISYQEKLRKKKMRLVYIDDLHEEKMVADVVINHSPLTESILYKKEDHTRLFLGCEYALLRHRFLEYAKKALTVPGNIETAFISMGGGDEFNLTLKLLRALKSVGQLKHIHIVVGAAYPHVNSLQTEIKNTHQAVEIHSNLSEEEMVTLITKCDIAFCPASNICMELIAIKKIIFCGISASNQQDLYSYFTTHGLAFDLGYLHKTTQEVITEKVSSALKDPSQFKSMLQNQKNLIDGKSGERINRIISELFV